MKFLVDAHCRYIEQIVEAFTTYDFIEIDRALIIFHT